MIPSRRAILAAGTMFPTSPPRAMDRGDLAVFIGARGRGREVGDGSWRAECSPMWVGLPDSPKQVRAAPGRVPRHANSMMQGAVRNRIPLRDQQRSRQVPQPSQCQPLAQAPSQPETDRRRGSSDARRPTSRVFVRAPAGRSGPDKYRPGARASPRTADRKSTAPP